MRAQILLGAALLTAGCRVPPPPPPPAAYAPAANSAEDIYKEANGWRPAQPSEAAARGPWWQIFGDAELNTLEQQVDLSNQTLKIAEARFRQARDLVHVNRAAQSPQISTAPNIASVRESQNQPYQTENFPTTGQFVLPFDISYEADIWGRVRRQVAASREEAQAVAADLESARLLVHAELALDYFELRNAEAQKRLLDQTVASYEETLKLATSRFEEGAAPKSEVAQARTQLESARVADTDSGVQRAQYEHAIAVLLGKPPASLGIAASGATSIPPAIPVDLPSQLLERRPDIAAAERRVAEANEQIGIARTAFFPTIVLDAQGGLEGNTLSNWLIWPSRFWAVGPQMAETLFDAGRRRATTDAARAGYDGSVAAYRQSVLTAFQQVEDNLAQLRILDREAEQQQQATASAQESLDLATNRYKEGADPYLQVLTAQTALLANQRNDLDIERRRMDASVLLIKALGGGWTTAALPPASSLK